MDLDRLVKCLSSKDVGVLEDTFRDVSDIVKEVYVISDDLDDLVRKMNTLSNNLKTPYQYVLYLTIIYDAVNTLIEKLVEINQKIITRCDSHM